MRSLNDGAGNGQGRNGDGATLLPPTAPSAGESATQ